MTRYFTSMVTVVILTMVLIAWAPIAKGGFQFDTCFDFCEDQAICQCAKLLGGSVRLTLCNIGAACVGSIIFSECECDVDPICKPWEKDIVIQSFPPEPPFANNCFPMS